MFRRNFLVIYDIGNDARRRKVVKILEQCGFRVQYSAFECMLNFITKRKVIRELEKVMKEEDSIRIYKLPASVYILGEGEQEFEDTSDIVVM